MPREFRKRGRGNRARPDKKQDEIPILPEPLPSYQNILDLALPEDVSQCEEPRLDRADPIAAPSPFPEPDPDLKAYWRQIDEKIQELERLGAGAAYQNGGGDNVDKENEEDERQLLLRSALEELSGHELSLAADPETSIILERLIYSMDDFAKRVLADRFMSQFVTLSSHRHASHVVQTLLVLSAPVLIREAQESIRTDGDDLPDLPPMHLLLAQACEDILSDVVSLSQDATAAHVLLALFMLVSGKPIPAEQCRSRKSAKWRSKQGQLRSVFHKDQEVAEFGVGAVLPVPTPLRMMGDRLYEALKSAWCASGGEGTRNAACNPVTNSLLQVLLGLETDKGEAEEPGSMVDNLLEGLVTSQSNPHRSEFVETCLRDVTASHAFEGVITRLSPACFSRFYSTYFARRMGQLSNHPVTNFLTGKVISRLDHDQFFPALQECDPKMVDCIDNYRTAALQAFISRSKELGEPEQREVISSILRAFGLNEEGDKQYVFPCLISLMRLEYFRKTTAFQHITNCLDTSDPDPAGLKLPDSNIQGSLLLQGLLQLAVPDLITTIVKSVLALPLSVTIAFSRDPIASRALDSILTSPTVAPVSRRQFISRFIGNYPQLADDRVGSRIADLCWAVADVYTKEKIATSLVGQINGLQRSAYGHYFVRKLDLPFFERQRDAWKASMLQKFPPKQAITMATSDHKMVTLPLGGKLEKVDKVKKIEKVKTIENATPKSDLTTRADVTEVKETKRKKKKDGLIVDGSDELEQMFQPLMKKKKKLKKSSDQSNS